MKDHWFKEENQNRFALRFGVIGWGVPVGFISSLALVFSHDLSNHPLANKIAIILAMTLIVGPFFGWFFGHLIWGMRRFQLAQERKRRQEPERLENRLAALEAAIRENSRIMSQAGDSFANPVRQQAQGSS